jgi:hypothetical protein
MTMKWWTMVVVLVLIAAGVGATRLWPQAEPLEASAPDTPVFEAARAATAER